MGCAPEAPPVVLGCVCAVSEASDSANAQAAVSEPGLGEHAHAREDVALRLRFVAVRVVGCGEQHDAGDHSGSAHAHADPAVGVLSQDCVEIVDLRI